METFAPEINTALIQMPEIGLLSLSSHKEEANDLILTHLNPQSIVSYRRSYYASFEGKVRITIDRDLKTFRQDRNINPNLSRPKHHFNLIIMEMKVDVPNFHLIREVCEDIPFNPQRFSKYCESLITTKSF